MLSKNAELISNCYSVDSLVHTIDKYHPPLDVVIKFKNSSMSDHYESPYILNFKNVILMRSLIFFPILISI